MTVSKLTSDPNFWSQYQIRDEDLEFLYNYLLEKAEPLAAGALLSAVVDERISHELKLIAASKSNNAKVYKPSASYAAGDVLKFPQFNMMSGEVISERKGNNHNYPALVVIDVKMTDGTTRHLATGIDDHALNSYTEVSDEDPNLQSGHVLQQYGQLLSERLLEKLETSDDIVSMEEKWFPKSLLVDINQGYLNLAEALLEMENGGPLLTRDIMNGIELPHSADEKLVEFSLNYAMAKDSRFDDVGPSGDTLWYLNRLEPEVVLNAPKILRSTVSAEHELENEWRDEVSAMILDELEPQSPYQCESASLALIYPHWRIGSLPLCRGLASIFPTAIQSNRIQFNFVDKDTAEKISGWVVLDQRYVYGLREWFLKKELIPGSIVHLEKSIKPGEIIVSVDRNKTARDWVRSATLNDDGNISFSMMKQSIPNAYDPRLVNFINNPQDLDAYWQKGAATHAPIEKVCSHLFRELGKLNHQGQVHAEELYGAVNLVKRATPTHILNVLKNAEWAASAGNLYFHLK